MHGYFVSLRLYDAARIIANPFVYEEHHEKLVKNKMDKLAESRIRTRKGNTSLPKVNRRLAEKILEEEAKKQKRDDKKKEKASKVLEAMDVDESENLPSTSKSAKASILKDERFKALFENPDFQVNENSREFALLNPSGVAQRLGGMRAKIPEGGEEDDSDGSEDPRRQDRSRQQKLERPSARHANVRMVDAAPRMDGRNRKGAMAARDATFGQRKQNASSTSARTNKFSKKSDKDMPMEYTWVPEANGKEDGGASQTRSKSDKRPGVEYFGSGMEKGGEHREDMDENERHGRTKRRSGMRSGGKNAFRR